MLEEKLAKSLEEIEAKAEEVLSKSEEVEAEEENSEVTEGEEVEKAIKPEEVADGGAGTSNDVGEEDAGEKEDKDEDEDEDKKDDKKDDKEVAKSEADEEEADEEVEKSIVDEFTENEKIAKSLEVSDFLSEFTKVNGSVIESLRNDINKSLETSTQTATILAKSFGAIMKSQEGLTDLVKSQAKELSEAQELIKSLQNRLDEVEKQPAVRKSVINTMEKSFDHSAGITSKAEPQELSKAEKVQKLTDFAMEGKHGVTVSDVVAYESTGQLRPELEQYLK